MPIQSVDEVRGSLMAFQRWLTGFSFKSVEPALLERKGAHLLHLFKKKIGVEGSYLSLGFELLFKRQGLVF